MGKVTFGSYDEELLIKKYNEALQDDGFKKLVSSIDLPSEDLMKYTSKLEESVIEIKNCANCKSLHECKNRCTGYLFYPSIQSNHLRFDEIACPYMQKKIKESEYTCTYYEMPEALKNASMRDIDTSDAKRVDTIKWLKNFYDTYQSNPHQKGLYLTGSFGSGKTYLICAMLNELSLLYFLASKVCSFVTLLFLSLFICEVLA